MLLLFDCLFQSGRYGDHFNPARGAFVFHIHPHFDEPSLCSGTQLMYYKDKYTKEVFGELVNDYYQSPAFRLMDTYYKLSTGNNIVSTFI